MSSRPSTRSSHSSPSEDSAARRVEVLLQALPAAEVVVLQLGASSACRVGRQTARVSNMNAIVSLMTSGFERSARLAFSKVSASGPWPLMLLCRLAPPGTNPSALAS